MLRLSAFLFWLTLAGIAILTMGLGGMLLNKIGIITIPDLDGYWHHMMWISLAVTFLFLLGSTLASDFAKRIKKH